MNAADCAEDAPPILGVKSLPQKGTQASFKSVEGDWLISPSQFLEIDVFCGVEVLEVTFDDFAA